MMFLRNLTPAVLFYSIFLFSLGKVSVEQWDMDNVLLWFSCIASLFIATSVMIINVVSFSKKLVQTLRKMHNREDLEPEGGWATLKALWSEANVKQLVFFFAVTCAAIFMVLLYGTKYAMNFYSSVAAMAD